MFCVSLKGSRASDDYQPGSLGSCFLSADVAPVIQLADLTSDCRATSVLVGQLGSAAAQHRHPVEKQQSEAAGWKDADAAAAPHCKLEEFGGRTECFLFDLAGTSLSVDHSAPHLVSTKVISKMKNLIILAF